MNEDWNVFEELLVMEDEAMEKVFDLEIDDAPWFLKEENCQALEDLRIKLYKVGANLLSEVGDEAFVAQMAQVFSKPGPLNGWDPNQLLQEVKNPGPVIFINP